MKAHKIAFAILLSITSGFPTLEASDKDNQPVKTVLAADNLKVDPAKSEVLWKATKVGGEHSGTVKIESGTLVVEGNKLKGGSFVMNMTSIEDNDITDASMNQKLVNHLKSEDFFSVEKYPKSKFKITKAEVIPNAKAGSPNYTITGDLTIKDKTHSVTFPAVVDIKGNTAQATAQIDLDRTKWDIKYRSGFLGTAADKIIHDNFILDIKLTAGTSVAQR